MRQNEDFEFEQQSTECFTNVQFYRTVYRILQMGYQPLPNMHN